MEDITTEVVDTPIIKDTITNDYIVKIDDFEGPLDVLLHLIQKSKVDIMDVSIAQITDQYIQYLHSMRALDLEVAADYILMSARLIEMKSRWLLPQMREEDEVEEDPRAELIRRLLEYKKYKDVTAVFKTLENDRQLVYSKELSDISAWVHDETLLNLEKKRDVYQLVMAFDKMLQRQKNSRVREVTMQKQEISIDEQVSFLEDYVTKERAVNISKLVHKRDRSYVVITFLAVLQLVRVHRITVEQDENFSDILLLDAEDTE